MLRGCYAVARTGRGKNHNNTLVLGCVLIRLHDRFGKILPDVEYEVEMGDQRLEGRSDSEGVASVGVTDGPQTCVVRWDRAKPGPDLPDHFHYEVELLLDPLDLNDEGNVARHLENLGYKRTRNHAQNLRDFQSHHGLEPTGELDSPTKDKLAAICDAYSEAAEDPEPAQVPDAPENDQRT